MWLKVVDFVLFSDLGIYNESISTTVDFYNVLCMNKIMFDLSRSFIDKFISQKYLKHKRHLSKWIFGTVSGGENGSGGNDIFADQIKISLLAHSHPH